MLAAAASPPPPPILAHHHHHVPFSHTSLTFPLPHHYSASPSPLRPFHFIGIDPRRRFRSLLLVPTRVAIAQDAKGEVDYELRKVLELATYSELYELERILFGSRGWRPTYRNVLLDVRKKLNVPCSSKLPTEDLEIRILHTYVRQLDAASET